MSLPRNLQAHTTSPGPAPAPARRDAIVVDCSSHEVEQIVRRMRAGDREAAATFITRYGSRLRRRIRGKLGPSMRRLFDSQEILSTVGRRLDLYVRNGRLEAAGENQLWSLIFKMADNALLDKLRVLRRLEQVESSDGAFAQSLLHELKQAESNQPDGADGVIDEALRFLEDTTDRQVLSMWLGGHPHALIGQQLGISEAGIRMRWRAIKRKLREHLGAGRE